VVEGAEDVVDELVRVEIVDVLEVVVVDNVALVVVVEVEVEAVNQAC
jgi:hypothetical protein